MPPRAFEKVLIANRGEIACRIARTAHSIGYRTVALFSDADADAQHVRMMHEAVRIGRSLPRESYLKIETILGVAAKTGADAIHPGYGFLAENASFAEACTKAGLVFIGPPAHVIRKMGDKASAKALMLSAGIPCVPGYWGEDQSDARLTLEAGKLGFPLLIKAVAGGGGLGIRAVSTHAELSSQISAARREAQNAFGSDRLMLERLIEQPRHLEVQIFGDGYGNVVQLHERDCSVQRRRQKIVEEAPSPVLTPAKRDELTHYALEAARAAGYQNAGTVEFIADQSLSFYFLEMNTRLQVEHPVTEMVTGLDLVEWQLRIAAGEPLPLSQDQIPLRGHAIEARLCAEDPYDGFKPQTGTILHWRPAEMEALRIDTGIVEGSEVTPFYDPLIAKIIAHGSSREEAARSLALALEEAPILGLPTNQHFLARLLRSGEFHRSELTTNSLDELGAANHPLFAPPTPAPEVWALAAVIFAGFDKPGAGFCSGSMSGSILELICSQERRKLSYRRLRKGGIAVNCGETSTEIAIVKADGPAIVYDANGVQRRAIAVCEGASLHLSAGGSSFVFSEPPAQEVDENTADGCNITSPVAGLVIQVMGQSGQRVRAGEILAVIEAMKMEIRVRAEMAGCLVAVHAREGAQVKQAALLFEIEKQDEPANV
ncbi:MAG: biotin carboxylase N-terminal domain-containing protein [Rhodomicrobium sp.]